MLNKKRILFYPYSDLSYGLVSGFILKGANIDVVSPNGIGADNKDMGYVVNRNETNKTTKSINEIEYKKYDELVISSNIDFEVCKNEVVKIINNCKMENMEIIYLGENAEIIELLKLNSQDIISDLENIKKIETMINRYTQLNLPMYRPNTPVVYIGGVLETIDSFNISLQVKVAMERLGYKVSLITKELDGKIFGAINYPELFMGKDESIEEQIRLINRQVQAVDYVEKPDIILLDIPKGMMQYSKRFINTFGIYTYMISKSILPNYFILTIPIDLAFKEYIEEIDRYFKNTIEKSIDVLNITNALYDIGTQVTNIVDKPIYISENDINKKVVEIKDNCNINITNLNIKENINIMINNMIKVFS